jgi:hypothetical protein
MTITQVFTKLNLILQDLRDGLYTPDESAQRISELNKDASDSGLKFAILITAEQLKDVEHPYDSSYGGSY